MPDNFVLDLDRADLAARDAGVACVLGHAESALHPASLGSADVASDAVDFRVVKTVDDDLVIGAQEPKLRADGAGGAALRPADDPHAEQDHDQHNDGSEYKPKPSHDVLSFPLHLAWRPLEQRDASPPHPFGDGVAEKLHDPRQIDLDAHDLVQHLDPAGDPLPHCRGNKAEGVLFPVVIEPAEENAELWPQPRDAAVEATPRLLPAEPMRDRND